MPSTRFPVAGRGPGSRAAATITAAFVGTTLGAGIDRIMAEARIQGGYLSQRSRREFLRLISCRPRSRQRTSSAQMAGRSSRKDQPCRSKPRPCFAPPPWRSSSSASPSPCSWIAAVVPPDIVWRPRRASGLLVGPPSGRAYLLQFALGIGATIIAVTLLVIKSGHPAWPRGARNTLSAATSDRRRSRCDCSGTARSLAGSSASSGAERASDVPRFEFIQRAEHRSPK